MCAACDMDTRAAKREIARQAREASSHGARAWRTMTELGLLLRLEGFDVCRSLWEMDHAVPLASGGKNEIENLWTLCQLCHRAKTARENRLRARPPLSAIPVEIGVR